jgi:N-dimethylarginine dimethylaminohydrolase
VPGLERGVGQTARLLPVETVGLVSQLASRGFEPVFVDISELRKSGGGPKCATMELRG